MAKIIFLILAAGLIAAVVAGININDVTARPQPEFIQISVLAEHQADYGVDEHVVAIPAVSIEIIEDAARDFQVQPSVRIITYTSLPTEEPRLDHEERQSPESVDEIKHDNSQGDGNDQGDTVENDNDAGQGNNGNNGNGNGNNEDKNKDKNKNKDKEKDKDRGNGGGGGKDAEKEPKSEKKE